VANYAYIYGLNERRFTAKAFRKVLVAAVKATLDDRWRVRKARFEDGGPVFLVTLPGTAAGGIKAANRHNLAPKEDVGFAVAVQNEGATVAFRHGLNGFERWAQGRVEEQLADDLNRPLYFDSTDTYQPAGTSRYRIGTTYLDYVTRKLEEPFTEQTQAWLDRLREEIPPGHA
jgi:hypothetical protein